MVTIGIVVGLLVLSLLVMAAWFVQKRKKKRAGLNIGYTMPSPFASSQNSGNILNIAHLLLDYFFSAGHYKSSSNHMQVF